MKKFISAVLCVISAICLFGCGSKQDEKPLDCEGGIGDRTKLYGVCYEPSVRLETEDLFNVSKDTEMLKNLGVTSMRFWMQTTYLLENPTTVKEDICKKMHKIIASFQKAGITVTGMSHTNFNSGITSSGKPARDVSSPTTEYVKWLENYRTSFRTLAKEFPEITQWEIDNEVNNTDFMKNLANESVYSQEQMAEIATDILWYGSKGIHEGNAKAKTVLSGLVGLYSGRIKTFLEKVYLNIESGEYGYDYAKGDKKSASKNPDDYFEIACWHPYIEGAFSQKVFKKYNDEIYRVILEHEKKHKKVIFSEVGFSNTTYAEKISAKYLTEMFTVIREQMPYVESVHYYKLFDYADAEKYWTHTISRYGLFYDPDPSRRYTNNESDGYVVAAEPKPAALAFQQLAGGSGELNIYKL